MNSGRDISAPTLAKWVHSMPASSKIVDAIEIFTGVESTTSEQHVELRESRRERDSADSKTLLEWLSLHNPFQRTSSHLVSLLSGVVADKTVNCDDALQVGISSMSKIAGIVFSEIHLKRKNSVKPLAKVTKSIKVREEAIRINPNQLLHRIICVVWSEEELAEYLQ